eukprot:1506148-Pleurochrysis_carterae.AAC.2
MEEATAVALLRRAEEREEQAREAFASISSDSAAQFKDEVLCVLSIMLSRQLLAPVALIKQALEAEHPRIPVQDYSDFIRLYNACIERLAVMPKMSRTPSIPDSVGNGRIRLQRASGAMYKMNDSVRFASPTRGSLNDSPIRSPDLTRMSVANSPDRLSRAGSPDLARGRTNRASSPDHG